VTVVEHGGIFISYRRKDASHLAARLYGQLSKRLGKGQVFMDVDMIEPGADFAEEINRALSACKVLLAVIGPAWLTATDEAGRRRLDDLDDFVRREIEAALTRGMQVIPILEEGTVMPGRQDLPDSLASFAGRNAFVIRHESFDSDAARLCAKIEGLLTARILANAEDTARSCDEESEVPLPPPSEIDAPRQLRHLPPGVTFIGRHRELAELDRQLARPSAETPGEASAETSRGPRICVVHGLGGVGKSTLAVEYAWNQKDVCNPIWHVTADNRAAVREDLAERARGLHPALLREHDVGQDDRMEFAVQYLSLHKDWLLILDNVHALEDVRWLLNRVGDGQVVITSRLGSGWQSAFTVRELRLESLPEKESVEMLTSVADPGQGEYSPSWPADAAHLVRELGYLPLAIKIAGGYLDQVKIPPAEYRALLRKNPGNIIDRRVVGDSSGETIARIWGITVDRLADEERQAEKAGTPLVLQLLRVLAWFGPEPVPREVFDRLDLGDGHNAAVQESLGKLAGYHLITLTGNSITVHRLVQLIARTPSLEDPHRRRADIEDARDVAIRLVNAAVPGDHTNPRSWVRWRAMLPHIRALAEHIELAADNERLRALFNRTALFLFEQGPLPVSASPDQSDPGHQEDSPAVAVSYLERTKVADTYEGFQGRRHFAWYAGTETDVRQVMVEAEGRGDVNKALLCEHDLGWKLIHGGDLAGAEQMFRKTIAGQELLPQERHNMFASQYGLGFALLRQGRLPAAEDVLRNCFTERVKDFGDRHPHVLETERLLATVILYRGRTEEARKMLRSILARQQEALPPGHRETQWTAHLLDTLDIPVPAPAENPPPA
jgi:hypothetical protein